MKTARLAGAMLALRPGIARWSDSGQLGGQAQEASPPRPSHIHVGDCDELGEVMQPLTNLTVPGRRRARQRRRGGRRGGIHAASRSRSTSCWRRTTR